MNNINLEVTMHAMEQKTKKDDLQNNKCIMS